MVTKPKQPASGLPGLGLPLKGEPSSSEPSTAIGGIDRDTYETKARQMLELNGWKGQMIAPRQINTKAGDHIVATPHEWGAWRAYFIRLKLRGAVNRMDRQGYYMVPAQWPHLFDIQGRADRDYEAGNAFAQELGDERAAYMAHLKSSPEARKAVVDGVLKKFAAMHKMPGPPRHGTYKLPPEKPKASYNHETGELTLTMPKVPPSEELKAKVQRDKERGEDILAGDPNRRHPPERWNQ